MSQHTPEKGIALYSIRETELWERAESKARREMCNNPREGEVLAKICAEYIDEQPMFSEA